MADRLRAVPAWAWVGCIVVLSFALRAWLARGMAAPFIFVDELIYSELAKSLASGDGLLVREVPTRGYGIAYPLAIAPAYALFDAVPDAYAATKTINSLVMSLAAIPAYLLARQVLRPGLSVLAALLAVAVPSMVYTATVMSENAFYPVFLLAALALVRMVERPTSGRQLGFLAALALGLLARPQALTIAPAALTAPFALAAIRRASLRATLRPYRLLYAVVVLGAGVVAVAQVARGHSLSDLLGAYAVAGSGGYDAGAALRFLLYHVAELDLYVGVIPFAALLLLCLRSRALDERLQAYLAAVVPLLAWFTLAVAVFASRFADRIQERNVFVLVPLVLVALLAWVERGVPRPPVAAVAAAAVAAGLVLAIPFERFVQTSAKSDTLMLLPWWSVQDTTGLEWVAELAFLLALALALAFLLVPRRLALGLPLVVLAYWAVALQPVWWGSHGVKQAGAGALFQGIRDVDRDWIDRAVREGDEVVVLWTGRSDRFTINQNEFFNRRVGRVFYTAAPTPGGIGESPVSRARGGGFPVATAGVFYLPTDGVVSAPYALLDGSVTPDGVVVARDEGLGTTLWRLTGPLSSRTTVTGLYADGNWSGPVVTWRLLRCRPGTLRIALHSDPSLFTRPQVVAARGDAGGASVRFRPDDRATLQLRVAPGASAACTVRLRVSPTAVPADVQAGSGDTRRLGAHFDAFAYEADS